MALATIIRCLSPDEDAAVQLFAARTIENLTTVERGPHLRTLLSHDVIVRLFHVLDRAKSSGLRRSASAGVFHLSVLDISLVQHLVDKVSAPAVAKLLQDSHGRVRQAMLSTFVLLFSNQGDTTRAQLATAESKECIDLMLKYARGAVPLIRHLFQRFGPYVCCFRWL